VGDTITSSKEKELEIVPGNCMPLSNMPLGKN
jgi:ribosomal protein L2